MKNVILLTLDTVRKDVFGCCGNKNGLTPFIDSLQDKCIRFTKGQAICRGLRTHSNGGPYMERRVTFWLIVQRSDLYTIFLVP